MPEVLAHNINSGRHDARIYTTQSQKLIRSVLVWSDADCYVP